MELISSKKKSVINTPTVITDFGDNIKPKTNVRYVEIKAVYKGKNISREISDDILEFSYTDNATGNADTIRLVLKDERMKWINEWRIERGDYIDTKIILYNFNKENSVNEIRSGRFYVDNPKYSDRKLYIDAISTPQSGTFLSPRSQFWENTTLRLIAKEIANRSGYNLIFDSYRSRAYKSLQQDNASDMSFLNNLCESTAHAFKVSGDNIIIYDFYNYEQKKVVANYKEIGGHLGYEFVEKTYDTDYDVCRLTYQDNEDETIIEGRFERPDRRSAAKTYTINDIQVYDVNDANYMCKSKLRIKNMEILTGTINVPVNCNIYASTCIMLEGFGFYSGKYFVDSVEHSIGSGYSMNLTLHKCLEGY